MAINAQSYNHHNFQNHHVNASQFTQLNTLQQHSTILHHPQPLSFGTLLHPTPIMPSAGMNQHSSFASASSIVSKFSEQPKLTSSFDFPSINSNFYKPFNQQIQQLSPTNSKSTISIDSSSASSVSERIMSPHSTADSHSGNIASTPPPVSSTPPNANANYGQNVTSFEPKVSAQFSVSSTSSISPLPNVPNGNLSSSVTNQQTTRTNMQNGLLDILMCPDKYQELIQYHQVQNSIIFPSLHHAAYPIDALNPRLPTWEFLQVTKICIHVYPYRYTHILVGASKGINYFTGTLLFIITFCLNDYNIFIYLFFSLYAYIGNYGEITFYGSAMGSMSSTISNSVQARSTTVTTRIMERTFSFKFCPMECTLGFGIIV